MKITNKQMEILEKHFNVYNDGDFSLEQWTNGGVDMFIYLDTKSNDDIVTQLKNYLKNFDINEEIDIYRQDERYKKDFTILESVKDFENWVNYIKNVINELKTGISVKKLSLNEIMVQKIDNLIIDEWKEYSPSELNDLIVLLIQNHEFYTKEQINNLIEDLEKLKDLY